MRILNITHSPYWFPDHFTYLLTQTGHTGETWYHSEGNFSAETANRIWNEQKDYFNQFDAVLVSHTASWCRVFLQNNWTKPLFVWFFFRFDHDVPDLNAYYDLLINATIMPNVKFFAATEYDRRYAHNRLIVPEHFPLEIVTPFLTVNNEDKTPIPCHEDKFYLVGKHNESLIMPKLQKLGVPFYHQSWETCVPDLRTARGIVHIPYVFATRSLIENIASENVYFLPDQVLLGEIQRDVPGFFWDGGMPGEGYGDFSLSEWYNNAYPDLFVYYSSFEELKGLSDGVALPHIIANKKKMIREFKSQHYEKTLRQWKELLE
jgi:hypothetical protein